MPGSGSDAPRSGSAIPGGAVPGGAVPGGAVPGGAVPGGATSGGELRDGADLRGAGPRVAAVVLCGGTARRFGGGDKTAAALGDSTVLDTLLDALPPSWPVVCVGEPRTTHRSVRWAREDPPLGGPVAGIAAGLTALRDDLPRARAHAEPPGPAADLVVVLAGDQPHAGPAARRVADALAHGTQAATEVDTEVVAARGPQGRAQLLLAAYRWDALARSVTGDVAGRGVYRTFAGLAVRTVVVPASQALDVDTPADLRSAARSGQQRPHSCGTGDLGRRHSP